MYLGIVVPFGYLNPVVSDSKEVVEQWLVDRIEDRFVDCIVDPKRREWIKAMCRTDEPAEVIAAFNGDVSHHFVARCVEIDSLERI